MVLKLYGSRISPNTRRIVHVLRWKNIPFEYVEIDMTKGEHKSEANLARNPFGNVPSIDDDGFVLYETRAITRYLEDKYPDHKPKFIPTGLKEKARFEQAASFELSSFEPHIFNVVVEKIFKPFFGAQTDVASYNNSLTKLTATIDVYEKILAKQKYLAGDEFTYVDLYHLAFGDMLPKAGSNLLTDPSRPNVARWWKEISEHEQFVAVNEEGAF